MTNKALPDYSALITEAHAWARPIKPTRKCEAGRCDYHCRNDRK